MNCRQWRRKRRPSVKNWITTTHNLRSSITSEDFTLRNWIHDFWFFHQKNVLWDIIVLGLKKKKKLDLNNSWSDCVLSTATVAYITFVMDSQTELKCNFTFKYSNQVNSVVEIKMNTAHPITFCHPKKNTEESLWNFKMGIFLRKISTQVDCESSLMRPIFMSAVRWRPLVVITTAKEGVTSCTWSTFSYEGDVCRFLCYKSHSNFNTN